MKVLYLCHRVPYPPNRGDRITTNMQLRRLRERHEVTCLTFSTEPGDRASIAVLEAEGIRVIAEPFHERARKWGAIPWLLTNTPMTLRCFRSPALTRAARELERSGLDLAVAYSSCMAPFVEGLRVPRVMVFGDLDSEKWLQYASEDRGPMRWVYAREARTLLEFEKNVARSFDVSTVVSEAEAETFERKTGVKPEIVGNGVDLTRFRPRADVPRVPGLVVFTGIMDYRPNVDGCLRFARQILPRIRSEVPDARFRIVGARPSKEILALAGGPVEVTGPVPETADHLCQASVAVAPLRLGRGLQNKVLEALACGTPLVASSNASAGIARHARAGRDLVVADSDEEFAWAVVSLLSDPVLAATMGGAGRRLVEQHFAWGPLLEGFDRALALARQRFDAKGSVAAAPTAAVGSRR